MQGYRKILLESDAVKACVGCGEATQLYVHHKDTNKNNNGVSNLEFRCPSCHRKVHPTPFNRSIQKRKVPVGNIYELRMVTDNLGLPSLGYKIIGRKST